MLLSFRFYPRSPQVLFNFRTASDGSWAGPGNDTFSVKARQVSGRVAIGGIFWMVWVERWMLR